MIWRIFGLIFARKLTIFSHPLNFRPRSASNDTSQIDFVTGNRADIFWSFDHVWFHCQKQEKREISFLTIFSPLEFYCFGKLIQITKNSESVEFDDKVQLMFIVAFKIK